MHRLAALILLVGLATASEAGTLRLQFPGGAGQGSGSSAAIELYYDLAPGEILSAIGGGFESIPGDPLEITGYTSSTGTPQPVLGTLGLYSSFGTFWAGGNELVGPQTVHFGTVIISPTATAVPGEPYALTFDHPTITILDETGGAASYDAVYGADVPGYYSYGGYGAPEIKNKKGVVVNPHNPAVFVFPEPGSLILLAVGSLAVLRRR